VVSESDSFLNPKRYFRLSICEVSYWKTKGVRNHFPQQTPRHPVAFPRPPQSGEASAHLDIPSPHTSIDPIHEKKYNTLTSRLSYERVR